MGKPELCPTVHYSAELLCEGICVCCAASQQSPTPTPPPATPYPQNGFAVDALDMPGHGESAGVRGLMTSAGAVEDLGLVVARNAAHTYGSLPLFLLGSSMGGAIALAVSRKIAGVAGVVLLAPMLMLDTPLWQVGLVSASRE